MGLDPEKIYYLAGPMTGKPQFNFPTFDKVALFLRGTDHQIISPAELDSPEERNAAYENVKGISEGEGNKSWGEYLSRDLRIIADDVQGIVFLPGWEESRGARLEAFLGLLCGHEFHLWIPRQGMTIPISSIMVETLIHS